MSNCPGKKAGKAAREAHVHWSRGRQTARMIKDHHPRDVMPNPGNVLKCTAAPRLYRPPSLGSCFYD